MMSRAIFTQPTTPRKSHIGGVAGNTLANRVDEFRDGVGGKRAKLAEANAAVIGNARVTKKPNNRGQRSA